MANHHVITVDSPFPRVLGVDFKLHPDHYGTCCGDNGTVWSRREPYAGKGRLVSYWYEMHKFERYGCLYVKFMHTGETIGIATLVLETFFGLRPTEKHIVGYLDDNKLNNRLDNVSECST